MGLTEDHKNAMKEAFTLFDTDSDSKIASTELGVLMRSLGGNPTQAQLKKIVAQEKLTAPLDFSHFLGLMEKHLKIESFEQQLRDAFKVLNKEATGFVLVSNLKYILTNVGEKLEPTEFDDWIKRVDVSSSGKLKYNGFIARMFAK